MSELVFILAAMRSALRSEDHPSMDRAMGLGLVIGLGLTAFFGGRFLESENGKPLGAIVTMVLTVGVAVMAVSLWGSMGVIRARVRSSFLWLHERHAWGAVFALAVVAAFRESLEAFIFLVALTQTVGMAQVVAGALLGLVAVGLLAAAWQLLRVRAGLLVIYRLSTLLLVLFSIHLALESVGNLLELEGAEPHAAWADAFKALLPGGSWHLAACAALMIYPLIQLTRAWWSEAEADPARENPLGRGRK